MDPITPNSKQEFRQMLYEAVLFRIEQDVDDVLVMLPAEAPPDVGESIRKEILDHSRATMDACSLEELTNGAAMERHVLEATRWATHRVHWYEARPDRG